jgi:hypothetical protein
MRLPAWHAALSIPRLPPALAGGGWQPQPFFFLAGFSRLLLASGKPAEAGWEQSSFWLDTTS